MPKAFSTQNPSKVLFYSGCVEHKAAETIQALNLHKILLIGETRTLYQPIIQDLRSKLSIVIGEFCNIVNVDDPLKPVNDLSQLAQECKVDAFLCVGGKWEINLAKTVSIQLLDKKKIQIICIPTTVSGFEMTDHVELDCIPATTALFTSTPFKRFERSPYAKPIAVFYDPLLWQFTPTDKLYPALFQVLSFAMDVLGNPTASPGSEMMAIECAKICLKRISTTLEQPSPEIIEDFLYCSYLGGECFYREEMELQTNITNLLLERFGIPTTEAATSLLPYMCWYHQNTLSMKAREEIAIYDLPNYLYEIQHQLIGHIKPGLQTFQVMHDFIPGIVEELVAIMIHHNVNKESINAERLSKALNAAIQDAPLEPMPKLPFNSDTSIVAALEHAVKCPDSRLREVLASSTKHLHRIIKECNITVEELNFGISFLTRVGQKCSENRQEFVMLADSLGLTSLAQDLQLRNMHTHAYVTPGALLGPFHKVGAPLLPYGSDLFDEVEDPNENIYVYEGRVLSASGDPIANAVLDVWHSDDHGFYDVQSDFRTSSSHLGFRGKFMTNEKGEWKFHTLPVKSYMLPRDGPVGELWDCMNQHSYLPAHVHFIVVARGFQPLITLLFPRPEDPYLSDDASFGVKDDLIKEPQFGGDDKEESESRRSKEILITQDFVLCPDAHYSDLDPLNYVPPTSSSLYTHQH